MKKLIALFGIMMAVIVIAQAQNSDNRSLDNFSKIKVGESINLFIEKGNKNSAKIETSGVDADRVLTEMRGDQLYIHMERGNYWRTTVDVWVTYTALEGVSVSSSAKLESKGTIKADEFFVAVSSSGRAELALEVDELEIDISSSGRAEIAGRANFTDIDLSSSGRLEAFALESKSVRADLSSSGKAEITVTEKIVADASSSGSLYYKGKPDKVLVDTSSSGKVRSAN